MILDELQSTAVQISEELQRLSIADENDPSAHQALRVTRACALALVDEIDRFRRIKTASIRTVAEPRDRLRAAG